MKVQVEEGRLKTYRQRVKQYRQNRTFQNEEKNLPTTRSTLKPTNDQMQEKPNDFELIYGNQKIWQQTYVDKQYDKH